jgi:hypothetical protein
MRRTVGGHGRPTISLYSGTLGWDANFEGPHSKNTYGEGGWGFSEMLINRMFNIG